MTLYLFETTLMVGILNNVKASTSYLSHLFQNDMAEDFCSILIECVTSFGLKNIDKCCTVHHHTALHQNSNCVHMLIPTTLQYPYSVRLCAKTNVTFMWQRGLDPCR